MASRRSPSDDNPWSHWQPSSITQATPLYDFSAVDAQLQRLMERSSIQGERRRGGSAPRSDRAGYRETPSGHWRNQVAPRHSGGSSELAVQAAETNAKAAEARGSSVSEPARRVPPPPPRRELGTARMNRANGNGGSGDPARSVAAESAVAPVSVVAVASHTEASNALPTVSSISAAPKTTIVPTDAVLEAFDVRPCRYVDIRCGTDCKGGPGSGSGSTISVGGSSLSGGGSSSSGGGSLSSGCPGSNSSSGGGNIGSLACSSDNGSSCSRISGCIARLGGCGSGCGGVATAADVGRESSRDGGRATAATPAERRGLEVGCFALVQHSIPGPPPGFAAETFLCPLHIMDKVQILVIDGDWIWGEKGGSQGWVEVANLGR